MTLDYGNYARMGNVGFLSSTVSLAPRPVQYPQEPELLRSNAPVPKPLKNVTAKDGEALPFKLEQPQSSRSAQDCRFLPGRLGQQSP